METLIYLDGLDTQRYRAEQQLDLIKAAVVAAGKIDVATAWPELTGATGEGVPSVGADVSQFEWEDATPDSFAKDMAAIDALTADNHVTVPEPPEKHSVRVSVPDLEWT